MNLLETFDTALNKMTREGSILSGGEWYKSEKLLATVPDLNPGQWPESSREFNNCYNFALNWRTDSRLQPGEIYLDKLNDPTQTNSICSEFNRLRLAKDITVFADWATSMIKQDGLVQIEDIRDCEGGFPVALFFGQFEEKNDFHFATLRRANAPFVDGKILQWVHKPGLSHIAFCSREPTNPSGLSLLFSKIAKAKYTHFAGFFKVDPAILAAPTPGGFTEQRRKHWQDVVAAYY